MNYKNLAPSQYQKSYLISLGWTIKLCEEKVKSSREQQIKYIKEGRNNSYRQINAAIYLKHKDNLAILKA